MTVLSVELKRRIKFKSRCIKRDLPKIVLGGLALSFVSGVWVYFLHLALQ